MDDKITTTDEAALVPARPDIGALMREAVSQGEPGVAALERLVSLQERIMERDAKAAFVSAMSDLRAKLPPIIKSVAGQHGVKRDGSRTRGLYAPLDSITPILDPLAAAVGLSYRFDRQVIPGRDHDYMVCIVMHRMGHEERTIYPCPSGQQNKGTNALQAIAVGESYAKRYALIAAFGITTADPDTDGHTTRAPATPVTDEQAATIRAMLDEVDADGEIKAKLLAWQNVGDIEDLPASRYAAIIKRLESRRGAS